MKAIIWIIILLLIGWGLWYFMKDNDVIEGTPSTEVQGVNFTPDDSATSTDDNSGDYTDKG